MTKNTEFHLDLAAATPAALQGYILSAMFDDWLKKRRAGAVMAINTIRDLVSYLENGTAYAEAIKLDDDTLELLHSLAKGLHNVAANELAFRRRVQERQP